MARKKNKTKNNSNLSNNTTQSLIITKEIHNRLILLANKEFAPVEFKIEKKCEKIFPAAWVSRKSQQFKEFHPHPNIWVINKSEKALNQLISAINSAKEIICLCSFLINNPSIIDALLKANQRNVRIYLLTTTKKFSENLSDIDPEYKKNRYNEHIEMIEKIAGKILIRCAEHFHAKFLLINPLNEENKLGFISTANFNTIPLTDRIEIIKKLSPTQIDGFYDLFCYAFWIDSTNEIFESNRAEIVAEKKIDTLKNRLEKIPLDVLYTFQDNHVLREKILNFIQNSENDITISTYGLDADHIILSELTNYLRSGKKIKIFTRPRPGQFDELIKLRMKNFEIYGHFHLHAKFICEDKSNKPGFLFTANFQKYGMDQSFDIGVVLNKEETQAMQKIYSDWAKSFDYVFALNVSPADLPIDTTVKIPKDRKFTDFKISKEKVISISKPKIASDIRNMKNSNFEKDIEYQEFNPENEIIPQNYIYKGRILPPVPPIGAKLIETKNRVQIFEKDSKRYYGISKKSDISRIDNIKNNDDNFGVFFDEDVTKRIKY